MNNTDKLITDLAEAFCRWPLPESVRADLCATEQKPGRYGTNLLTVVEARQMFTEVVLPKLAQLERSNIELNGERTRLRAALMATLPILDHDRDLSDDECEGCHDGVKLRRYALRHCQAALR